MSEVRAEHELLAARADVWALLAEPYHLPDWWPAYTGVHPDRRGLAEGARWTVTRGRTPGFFRRPGGQGTIVIQGVERTLSLGWLDVAQGLAVRIELANAGPERTRAVVTVEAPWWRLVAEGARGLPREALSRLHDLCQTAAEL
ncbi:MAG TPA: SRPBCC family protein [Gaiellaceae bacterium]